jgi:hypothetical protein
MPWVNRQMLHQFLSDPVALGEVFLAGLFFASSILISPPSQNIGFQEREQIVRVKWIYRFVELPRDRIFRETAEAIHLIAPGLTGSLLARLSLNPVILSHSTSLLWPATLLPS